MEKIAAFFQAIALRKAAAQFKPTSARLHLKNPVGSRLRRCPKEKGPSH